MLNLDDLFDISRSNWTPQKPVQKLKKSMDPVLVEQFERKNMLLTFFDILKKLELHNHKYNASHYRKLALAAKNFRHTLKRLQVW